jgi:uncharacterized repeat protein (TIGR03803 family)
MYPLITILSFNGNNGSGPIGNLVLSGGNLVGLAIEGGAFDEGVAFELSLPEGSASVLHSFTGGLDGGTPSGGLALGPQGNIYGTTEYGGNGFGTLFEIIPGSTTLVTLHSFQGPDGEAPNGNLVFDPQGNLYGTTDQGGEYNLGTVYRYIPPFRNRFGLVPGTFQTLHSFSGADGQLPQGLAFDPSSGNLYGSCNSGGSGSGTLFELSSSGILTTVHSFSGPDGASPNGVVLDSSGNLCGTTNMLGPAGIDGGTIFRLTPGGLLTTLHSFTGGADGGNPGAAPAFGPGGNLIATASTGGAGSKGTIIEVPANGSGWNLLYAFSGPDGSGPNCIPLLQPTASRFFAEPWTLFGIAGGGGVSGMGTVFVMQLPS